MLVIFDLRCFKALNVKFHSDSSIQRCPKTTLWTNNVFQSVQKSFSCSTIIFVAFAESRETSESDPITLDPNTHPWQATGSHAMIEDGG